MLDIEKIRAHLQDRIVSVVSDATGINRNTISAIKSGKKITANKSTIKALLNYLDISNDH